METLHGHKKGFTLIELLVVISIITLLSTVVLASLGATRIKTRDSVRKQNLAALRNALELYYADNGHYPATIPSTPGYVPAIISGVCIAHSSDGSVTDQDRRAWFGPKQTENCFSSPGATNYTYQTVNPNDWIPGLAPKYIPELPIEPSSKQICGSRDPDYLYMSNGKHYKLLAYCSVEQPAPGIDPFDDPGRPGTSFMVTDKPDFPAQTPANTYCYRGLLPVNIGPPQNPGFYDDWPICW
jgi:prepilin-type N-terminal cleavage/methylation domain-containing protein